MSEEHYAFHVKVRNAFTKVKREIFELRGVVSAQQEAINMLSSNEKALLLRIRKLEEAPVKREIVKVEQVQKVITKAAKKSYVGAKTSMKVHDENCPFAKQVNKENKIVFATKVKAFNKGFSPCKCLKK
jgi:hypothetical protein